ncbi:NTP transferase domain-containing protein [Sulfidibacter corallicola]|uniref:NTP transferase domain-containing protein n=1 Tax=Sulfidibacter corallicola TaxID=2818388 RepID=A0A8A4TX00_SULCO|nr:NTP transferase domain-containing protein [Sulfidibacter corallicola]QTD53654.1 NTP transferase domain-containing protein [Sulfidibacter corallicola]
MDVIAVVGARLNSNRLPRKHLLDLSGKPLIARIFDRLDRVPELRECILATTADSYNRPLVDWAEAQGRRAFAYEGDVNDLVGRIDYIVSRERPKMVLYICGDSPLIEPTTISRMIRALARGADRVAFPTRDGVPVVHEGIDLFPFIVWNRLVLEAEQPFEREHVGQSLVHFAKDLNHVPLEDDPVFYRPKLRLSVDTPSDYQFMSELYRRWYAVHDADSIVDLAWVLDEVDRDPALRGINAQVRQKTAQESSTSVQIVTATGPGTGMGHLSRAISVASGLQDAASAGVKLLIQGPSFEKAELDLLPHVFVEFEEMFETIERDLAQRSVQVVILDLPARYLGEEWLRFIEGLRGKGIKVVSLDFTVTDSERVDLQWVPSFFLRESDMESANLVFGWECFLLGSRRMTRTWKPGSELLVLTGGSDVHGFGDVLPGQLDEDLPAHFKVHWVRGPFAREPKLPSEPRLEWTVHENPKDLSSLITRCHFGFALYGVSLFECLHHGLPTVTLAPGRSDEDRELKALQQADLAVVGHSLAEAVDGLRHLIFDPHHARAISDASQQRLDGQGPTRLARRILDLLQEESVSKN